MRTNIVLDDDLVKEARQYSKARTKRRLIEEALETFIRVKAEERRLTSYRTRVRDLDEKLSGLALRESPHSVLRSDRERR